MLIPDERLREFQVAYRKDFGEEISPADARAMMHQLIAFYELVSRPYPGEFDEKESNNEVTT
jgi:hypothetical protein